MSQFELGRRAGISQPRVAQVERAEAVGTVELATLRRLAAALGCSLSYVLAPDESLEAMVLFQALDRAHGDRELAEQLVDQSGLWNPDRRVPVRPRAPKEPA